MADWRKSGFRPVLSLFSFKIVLMALAWFRRPLVRHAALGWTLAKKRRNKHNNQANRQSLSECGDSREPTVFLQRQKCRMSYATIEQRVRTLFGITAVLQEAE